MKKYFAVLATMVALVGGLTPAASASVQPNPITYCGFPDTVTNPRDIWKPIRAFLDGTETTYKIYGQVGWTCSPYPLVRSSQYSQLQKMDRYGVMQNYGTAVWTECGYVGEPACKTTGWVSDWTNCVESGWYRTKGHLEGWGPAGTEGFNSITRYSVKTYITC